MTVFLRLVPPEHAIEGAVDVEVCEQSTGREALVDFTLDATGREGGCHVVE